MPRAVHRLCLALAFAALVVSAPAPAQAQDPCLEPDNGTGTVTLPPPDCEYLSPNQVHMIIDGLPPGTTIILKPIHLNFICRQTSGPGCGTAGGTLGGQRETFGSTVSFQMSGTGALSGWGTTLTLPASVVTDTGPRPFGASVQSFPTAMIRLQGSTLSHPSFSYFEVVAGSDYGLPSPGKTTLTRVSSRTFKVDSEFDVRYRIRFQGSSNGALAGYAGETEGTVRMIAFDSKNR